MSRIDEALARARNSSPEGFQPLVAPGVESGTPVFPTEERDLLATGAPPAPMAAPPDPTSDESQPVVLGTVQGIDHLRIKEKLSITGDPRSVEQYRRVATRLYLMQTEQGNNVVLITSALPGEGKTLTAANLALTLSESYRRQVLLIDADLRRPSLHDLFEVPNVTGLNDGLRAEVERKVPLIRLTDHLSLLTAGRPDPDPTSVLSSDRMQRVVEEAKAKFEWVIIDTPPVALLTDAHLLASLVDRVLLVIRSGSTPLASIRTAVNAVGRERIAGVILNRSDDALRTRWYYYNKYYGYGYGYGYYGGSRKE